MNILLADSDRDLLQCYERLLTMNGHQVTTAFDGTQVVQLMAQGPYDLAILEENLPRVRQDRLLGLLREEHVPVIVLLNQRVTANHLLRTPLPGDYLSMPFLPEDLTALMDDVTAKAKATQPRSFCGLQVDVSAFRVAGEDIPLTAREINLLSALEEEKLVGGKHDRTIIQALNQKLRASGLEIKYNIEKGYRLTQA